MAEKELDDSSRGRVRTAAYHWRDASEPLRAAWDLETVKHLALINAAGFAGAATIAASSLAGSTRHPWMFIFFSAGLIAALLNMYSGAIGYATFMTQITRRIARFDSDDSYTSWHLFQPRTGLSKYLQWLGYAAGWISASCVVAGGVAVARVVM